MVRRCDSCSSLLLSIEELLLPLLDVELELLLRESFMLLPGVAKWKRELGSTELMSMRLVIVTCHRIWDGTQR